MEWLAWNPVIVLEVLAVAMLLFSLNWFIAPRLVGQVIAKQQQRRAASRGTATGDQSSPRRRPQPGPSGRAAASPAQ